MIYRLLADVVLMLHFAFVLFVLLGGVAVLRYPNVRWLHLPALIWGIVVQWANWTCPLTPLENYFRNLGGDAGYQGSFIEHFLSKLLYPENLTIELRYGLGLLLVAVNIAVYSYVVFVFGRRRRVA